MAKFLLQGASTNTDSGWVNISDCFSKSDQPDANLVVDGDPDGCTVTITVRPKGSSRSGVVLENGTFTAADCKAHQLSGDLQIKAAITSAGASTDIDVWVG